VDVLGCIFFHLPGIRRVRLAHIDDKKLRPAFELPVNSIENGNLPPERWSSVASKYQEDGLSAPKRR
jgi:hypothetical protein